MRILLHMQLVGMAWMRMALIDPMHCDSSKVLQPLPCPSYLRADLFVVPFLGGFIERDSPEAAYRLNREVGPHKFMTNSVGCPLALPCIPMTSAARSQAQSGNGTMSRVFRHLSHYNAETARRHLFLLTNSCGGCNRQACAYCSTWQMVASELGHCTSKQTHCGPRLALTLGPNSPQGIMTWLQQAHMCCRGNREAVLLAARRDAR